MKLEYQAIKLRRGDKWHCNFCPFERERSLTAIYKIISYHGSNNDYNDIAYICVECKKLLMMILYHIVMIAVELWKTG